MKYVIALILVLAVVFALTAWPRLHDVETGQTPEYPDLKVREYAASEEQVTNAVKALAGRLPGWTIVGAGRGPAGSEVRATRALAIVGLPSEVTVRIRRDGARSRVSVRSRTDFAPLDLGQNARNIRELLAALDREVR